MSRRFLALARPRVHHDALDWARRVATNGGSVSQSTLRAVSTFCDAIDRAAIRDRFYRLNLFCGTSLSACLVPLYRGPSLGGTQYGGSADTNNGPFVSGDYVETGASGGLLGNGTSKYLNTGLSTDALPSVATGHLSYWTRGGSVTNTKRIIGSLTSSPTTQRFFMDVRIPTGGGNLGAWGGSLAPGFSTNPGPTPQSDFGAGLFAISRTSSTSVTIYKNQSPLGDNPTQTASVTPAGTSLQITVFAGNNAGAVADYYEHRLTTYSIGAGMTDSQMSQFYTALNTFMGALSRT